MLSKSISLSSGGVAPRGHRLAQEQSRRRCSRKSRIHSGSSFIARDALDDLARQALIGLEDVLVLRVVEPVAVLFDQFRGGDGWGFEFCCHYLQSVLPVDRYSQDNEVRACLSCATGPLAGEALYSGGCRGYDGRRSSFIGGVHGSGEGAPLRAIAASRPCTAKAPARARR